MLYSKEKEERVGGKNMQLYNTLTKQKEELVPLEAGKIRMYVCGPTVYNEIHIGNARPMVVFDTVRRYLEYKGYEVLYISNFTDIDDKIIQKAAQEGCTAAEIAKRYLTCAMEDMQALHVKPATVHPKATEEMEEIIEMISILLQKGYAYQKDEAVYFRTKRFDSYGKLSKKNIEELEAGSRIAVAKEKEDPMDFILWKPQKPGEPAWETPWGKGRPGWHIECSAMIRKYLGDQIDIHAGGEDLVFPHHENEIAQTEAITGKPFAKYWMHNAFLNIDHKKMSKSEGNFFTVRQILQRYTPDVLRFFLLSAHYRSPLNFSDALMESAKHGLERMQTAIQRLIEQKEEAKERPETEQEQQIRTQLQGLFEKYECAMEDDFNTADAIAALFEVIKVCNVNFTQETAKSLLSTTCEQLQQFCEILGIPCAKQEDRLEAEVLDWIEKREVARKQKDFQKADEIRSYLLERGIVLEDTRKGVKWKKV